MVRVLVSINKTNHVTAVAGASNFCWLISKPNCGNNFNRKYISSVTMAVIMAVTSETCQLKVSVKNTCDSNWLNVKSATNITSGKGTSYPTSTLSMKFYYCYQAASACTSK